MKTSDQILEEIKKVKREMKSVKIGEYREYLRGMLDGLLFVLELDEK